MSLQTTEEFKNKVAVITGGSMGIGKGIARLLSSRGAEVAIIDVSMAAGLEVVASINASGGNAFFIQADVTDPKAVRQATTHILEKFGQVDILSCNAGIQRYGTIESTSEENWDEVMNTNLKSVFLCCKAFIPHLKKMKGSIVIMSSVQGFATQKNVLA